MITTLGAAFDVLSTASCRIPVLQLLADKKQEKIVNSTSSRRAQSLTGDSREEVVINYSATAMALYAVISLSLSYLA